ncbi:unnamed protein product [Rhodiola kirilowii]
MPLLCMLHLLLGLGTDPEIPISSGDSQIRNDPTAVSNSHVRDYLLSRDRAPRIPKPNKKYANLVENYVVNDLAEFALVAARSIETVVPETYKQAMISKNANEWKIAMTEEIESMHANDTWKLIPKPENARTIDCKWIFKLKEGISPSDPPRFKGRLVAKGFTQKEGIDYTEIFAPVVKYKTMRLLIDMVAVYDLELEQMDSPRQWNKKFDSCMISLGFIRSKYDSCLYLKMLNTVSPIYVLLYVDDILLICKSKSAIETVKKKLKQNFDMKNFGSAQKILGVKIIRDRKHRTICLSQTDYINKVLTKFSMLNVKPSPVPLGGHLELSKADCPSNDAEKQQMANVSYDVATGSVMYAMLCIRSDLAYFISVLSRFMSNPGLVFQNYDPNAGLVGYVDSDYDGNKDHRKSTTAFFYTWNGNYVSWKSQLQPIVTLSFTEAEYVAAIEAVKEALWLTGIVSEIEGKIPVPQLHMDNQSALYLCKDPVYHERSKHIDVRYHFIRDKIDSNEIVLKKISGDINPADFGTKIVLTDKFVFCRRKLHIDKVG